MEVEAVVVGDVDTVVVEEVVVTVAEEEEDTVVLAPMGTVEEVVAGGRHTAFQVFHAISRCRHTFLPAPPFLH